MIPPMLMRIYGTDGPRVVVVHGGPGFPGSVQGLAEGLAERFRVLEPFQRTADGEGEPLTVATHVKDLRALIEWCGPPTPLVVGWSWGAILTLCFGAAHPELLGPLALVATGSFEPHTLAAMSATMQRKLGYEETFAGLFSADPTERAAADARLEQTYAVDAIPRPPSPFARDLVGSRQTAADLQRLAKAGLYPAAFAAIKTPVLMLHGEDDPHPGTMIRESLMRYIPQIEYHSFPNCGHDPWRERQAREAFFAQLIAWLEKQAASQANNASALEVA